MDERYHDIKYLKFKPLCIGSIFHRKVAPIKAKMTCVAARKVISIGKPEIKKPRAEPSETTTAANGEINIAIMIGTWLASVKLAGGMTILGITCGMRMASDVNNAVVLKRLRRARVLVIVFKQPF